MTTLGTFLNLFEEHFVEAGQLQEELLNPDTIAVYVSELRERRVLLFLHLGKGKKKQNIHFKLYFSGSQQNIICTKLSLIFFSL